MMKKKLAILLITTLTLGLCACGSNGSDTTEAKKSDDNVITIMFSGTESDAYTQGEKELVDEFNKTNTYGVTIEAEFLASDDYKTKLATTMASDNEPDIFFTYELDFLKNYVDGGKVVSLQKYLDDDKEWKESFNEGTLDPLSFDGETYAIPMSQCMAVMYYNKKIFDKYQLEVPTTYDEFLDVCETLKNNGEIPISQAGTPENSWLISQYIQQLANGIAGYDLFESLKDGTGKWNDDAFVQAAKMFQEEVNNGYYEDGLTGVGYDESRALFMNGQAAMYFSGTWEVPNFEADSCAEKDNIACFTMPAFKEENNGIEVGALNGSFGISKNCKNVDAAVAFLKLLTSEKWEETWIYEYGLLPSVNIDIDTSKVSTLSGQVINFMSESKAITPWFDRLNSDVGNEFNNCGVSIANGDDAQDTYDTLEEYAESAN